MSVITWWKPNKTSNIINARNLNKWLQDIKPCFSFWLRLRSQDVFIPLYKEKMKSNPNIGCLKEVIKWRQDQHSRGGSSGYSIRLKLWPPFDQNLWRISHYHWTQQTRALIHSIEQTDFTIKQFQLKSEYLLKL